MMLDGLATGDWLLPVPVTVMVTVAGALTAPSLSVAVKVKVTSWVAPAASPSKSVPGSKL